MFATMFLSLVALIGGPDDPEDAVLPKILPVYGMNLVPAVQGRFVPVTPALLGMKRAKRVSLPRLTDPYDPNCSDCLLEVLMWTGPFASGYDWCEGRPDWWLEWVWVSRSTGDHVLLNGTSTVITFGDIDIDRTVEPLCYETTHPNCEVLSEEDYCEGTVTVDITLASGYELRVGHPAVKTASQTKMSITADSSDELECGERDYNTDVMYSVWYTGGDGDDVEVMHITLRLGCRMCVHT